jgi:glyoxylase-like metal-dependent hydrolase (beta-lactamase superfamily II)
MQLVFEQIRSGGDRNFGYLLGDRDAKAAIVVDPSYSPDQFVERAREQGLRITHIVNTHSHPDHVNGNERAVELTAAPLAAHPTMRPDVPLADGADLHVGALRLTILHVPGHCDDHIVLFEPAYRLLITGDLLFVGKVGGTRSDDEARVEWNSLQTLLTTIPDDVTVWPGHDYGARPSSTMGLEKQSNPFLRCRDLAEFLALKRDWPAYKKQLGLR